MTNYPKIYEYFETKKRSDGKSFVCLRDDAPPFLDEFVHGVHEGPFKCHFPNDWIYSIIAEAFRVLYEFDNDIENVTVKADIYDHELIEWLKEPYALAFCADWQEMCGTEKDPSVISMISNGQWHAKHTIYEAVHRFIEDNAETFNR